VNRVARWALAAYGIGLLLVGGLVGIVIRARVPDPTELLHDLAGRRALWIGANVLLIVLQAALTVGAPALGRVLAPRSVPGADAARGLLALAAGALVASGVFHGVLGAHVAAHVGPDPLDPDLVRSAEVLHALGDTTWFVGLGALTAAIAVSSAVWWRDRDPRLRRLARLGVLTAAVSCLQYGWFAWSPLGLFALPGALLMAAWFVLAGASTTGQPPVPVVEASST
jgi:hypothetical protein